MRIALEETKVKKKMAPRAPARDPIYSNLEQGSEPCLNPTESAMDKALPKKNVWKEREVCQPKVESSVLDRTESQSHRPQTMDEMALSPLSQSTSALNDFEIQDFDILWV